MVYDDPHITGWDFIPYTPETTKVVCIDQFNLYTEYTYADAYIIPSLKLPFSPLKMDDWKTFLSFWDTLFSGARVYVCIYNYI